MKPIKVFLNKPKSFWAAVRSLSQHVGYSKGETIIVPTVLQMAEAFGALGLNQEKIYADGSPTHLATDLAAYFTARARLLVEHVEPRLMNAERAGAVFNELHRIVKPMCPLPLNKQKGDKKAAAFLTGIVNMLVEQHSSGMPCDYDPRQLTTITKDGAPLRTFARRVDGAFPSAVNPVAVWEVKEYYYTTTFGSRVADGVYETLLDGMEIEELREHENIDVKHYLIIDSHFTWWKCGKAYLCRMFDMLHMGYVDEILFGYEVVEEMPRIVKEWKVIVRDREGSAR